MSGARSPRITTQQNTGSRTQAGVLLCCHCPEGHGARAETQLTAQRAAYLDHFHHLGGDDVLLYHVLYQLLQDQLLCQHHPVLLQRFLVTALHAARPQHPTWMPQEGPPRAGAAPQAAEEASSTRPDGPRRGAARSPSHRRLARPRSARARALPPSRAPGSERAAGPEIQTAPSQGACACARPPAPAPRCTRAPAGAPSRAGACVLPCSAGRAVVELSPGERAPRAL